VELTQKLFRQRLELLHEILHVPERLQRLQTTLHEKGVECAFIVPLLEIILEFDAVADVEYERPSETKHGQRFDFLVGGELLIETKALNTELDDHIKQLERYLTGNDAIKYGILTNGVDYEVWMKKSFVEQTAKVEIPHAPSVVKVLEYSLAEDSVDTFLRDISVFAKPVYAKTFVAMASVAAYYATGGRGRPPNVHEDKNTDAAIKERIRAAVSVEKGVYYNDVTGGKLAVGQRLGYRDECVEIVVEVTNTGSVVMKKSCANILDVAQAYRSGWGPMVGLMEKWMKEDLEFRDPLEIIRLAKNSQRLHNKSQYQFKPMK
jgi:hypothetical protein